MQPLSLVLKISYSKFPTNSISTNCENFATIRLILSPLRPWQHQRVTSAVIVAAGAAHAPAATPAQPNAVLLQFFPLTVARAGLDDTLCADPV